MLNSSTIKLNDVEFVELRDIIYQHASLTFTENKKYLLENRLSKRLHELNFSSFKDYITYLKYDPKKNAEIETLINLVTINETYFLRERPQMDYLIDTVLPALVAKGQKKIRIWSAAASSGEEAYSIAMLLTEKGWYNKADFDIFGTDINTNVINIAKKAEYRNVSFRGVPDEIVNRYFTKDGFIFKLKPEIVSKVKFSVANLLDPSLSSKIGKVDVIFCRNVLIYFDGDTKKRVIDAFSKILSPGGALFLGHSETLNKVSTDYEMKNFGSGIVYYR